MKEKEWLAKFPSHTGIEGNERADHLAEVGRLSSPLYDKCQRGTVVRPINIDLLHPSPTRAALGALLPAPCRLGASVRMSLP